MYKTSWANARVQLHDQIYFGLCCIRRKFCQNLIQNNCPGIFLSKKLDPKILEPKNVGFKKIRFPKKNLRSKIFKVPNKKICQAIFLEGPFCRAE